MCNEKQPVVMSRNELKAYRYICKCRRRRHIKRTMALMCVDMACAVIILVRVISAAMP